MLVCHFVDIFDTFLKIIFVRKHISESNQNIWLAFFAAIFDYLAVNFGIQLFIFLHISANK